MSSFKNKSPRWQRKQNKRLQAKKKSKIYLGLGFLFFILFLVFFNYLWQRARLSVWDGKSRLGMVTLGKEQIDVSVLIPEQKRKVSLKIPLNTIALVPFGFGEYQLGKVYELGKLEGEGGELLMKTIQGNFAILIDGFKTLDNSNLTWWDNLRMIGYQRVSGRKLKVIDLRQTPILEEDFLADGTAVFRVKFLLLDEVINRELFDEAVLAEELELAVLNASGQPGLASNFSRLIKNIGGDVTVVSNLEPMDNSKIQVLNRGNFDSDTVKFLSQIFKIEQVELIGESEYRADVVVIIGRDDLSWR